MKSWIVHLKNKFPGAKVVALEDSIDVFRGDEHLVAMRKDGGGSWKDCSDEFGCSQKFCLAPIPKDSRIHKVIDGKIAHDELAGERMKLREEFMIDGKVLSCHELKQAGFDFDEKQRVVRRPSK